MEQPGWNSAKTQLEAEQPGWNSAETQLGVEHPGWNPAATQLWAEQACFQFLSENENKSKQSERYILRRIVASVIRQILS